MPTSGSLFYSPIYGLLPFPLQPFPITLIDKGSNPSRIQFPVLIAIADETEINCRPPYVLSCDTECPCLDK